MTKPKWYERPGNRQQLLERIEALEGLIREGRRVGRRVCRRRT